jgi:hypothetical protein
MKQKTEHLPFTIRIVRTTDELERAVSVRQAAYARHVPDLAAKMGTPDATDCDGSAVVLLAESKLDGTPVGTMRIQTNALRPLALEQSVTLPEQYQGRFLAEATRLGVAQNGIGRIVKAFLFKSLYMYCAHRKVDWIVITARSPMDRMYEAVLFTDVFPDGGYIPMTHVGNIPHRVLSYRVEEAQTSEAAARHPLYDAFFLTHHPDIQVTGLPTGAPDFVPFERDSYRLAAA